MMERYFRKIEPNPNLFIKDKLRVAAYARVSTGKDTMLHSLETQVACYQNYISVHKDWVFKGIYTDEAFTGTKANRKGFIKLLNDCRNHQIDLIITKSISRFARNTVTLLEAVRELKSLGVDVYFEEQNIHTLSNEGELMLTILASYAQEESRSVSENMKWRIRKNFEEGKVWNTSVLGYRLVKGTFEVIPSEAEIVKRIYDMYLLGNGTPAIAKALNEEGLKSKRGHDFSISSIKLILTNYLYTGNLLLQRYYKNNHIDKKKMTNKGELPMYHVSGTHEAIIPLETFKKVQELIKIREGMVQRKTPHSKSVLTGKLVCANCGTHYRRRVVRDKPQWICGTYSMKGKAYCSSKLIPEETLIKKIKEALRTNAFDEELFIKRIEKIEVRDNNELLFYFYDKNPVLLTWQDRSRSESWTPEMREEARRKAIIEHDSKNYRYSSDNGNAFQSQNRY